MSRSHLDDVRFKDSLQSFQEKLVQQQVHVLEHLKDKDPMNRFRDILIEGFLVRYGRKVMYYYQYTPTGQLAKKSFYIDDNKALEEVYTYNEQGVLEKIDRFKLKNNPFKKNHTDNMTEYYDQWGNITQSINIGDDGEVVRTRYYDYEYDAQHNWVTCYLYLDGIKDDTPTITAKRRIEYYTD